MEKKKLLLVAVSVGVVMLIIIAIPLFIISPKRGQPVYSRAPVPVEIIPEPFVTAEPIEPAVIAETVIPEATEPVQTEVPSVTTITIPVPHTAAVPAAPTVAAVKPAAPKPAPARQPAAEKPTAPESAPKVTAKPAAPKPAAEPKARTDFWIQTGAFSTNERAEGAKELLKTQGITSIIDNSDVNGKTWYRVRIGPYVTENEANWWLALVKEIDGFSASQIRQTQAIR